jgi:activating signal cointegrator 1
MLDARVITLHEPWASAVALGLKHHETRSWETNYRGWLVIHAARKWSRRMPDHRASKLIRVAVPGWEPAIGKVVALAWLDDCRPTAPVPGHLFLTPAEPDDNLDREFGNWLPGRFAWRLDRVKAVPDPFPFRGQQGLKPAPPDMMNQIRARLREDCPC